MPARKTDLLIQLDSSSDQPLYSQLYEQICKLIKTGALETGDKLPSVRGLCDSLGVSHTTVERAYLQLTAESYVDNVPRSGFIVRHIDKDYFTQLEEDNADVVKDMIEDQRRAQEALGYASSAPFRYNLSFCELQPESFPRRIWAKTLTEVTESIDTSMLTTYQAGAEGGKLNKELSLYLRQSRGVACVPEQIVVSAGTEQSLMRILHLFAPDLKAVGHEEPGYDTLIRLSEQLNFSLMPLPVDKGAQSYLQALDKHSPRLIFVTPSHQFPTGQLMAMETRIRLLQWAQDHDAYIIEDDSCSEYRYETQAVPSLHSLDVHNRVIYLNNFSKALSPGLRVSYHVLPPALLKTHFDRMGSDWCPVPFIIREALGAFIEQGHWDRHVRRLVSDNRRRHDEMIKHLKKNFGDTIELSGIDSGMHFFAKIHTKMNQDKLIKSAADEGVRLFGAKRYWFSKRGPENCVLIGFSAVPLKDIPAAAKALKKAWL